MQKARAFSVGSISAGALAGHRAGGQHGVGRCLFSRPSSFSLERPVPVGKASPTAVGLTSLLTTPQQHPPTPCSGSDPDTVNRPVLPRSGEARGGRGGHQTRYLSPAGDPEPAPAPPLCHQWVESAGHPGKWTRVAGQGSKDHQDGRVWAGEGPGGLRL